MHKNAQDEIAFAQGFHFVVVQPTMVVYTTTKAEAFAEVRNSGGKVFALTDTRSNPEAPVGRTKTKEPHWTDPQDPVWIDSAGQNRSSFRIEWMSTGTVRFYDLYYNDTAREFGQLCFGATNWRQDSAYVDDVKSWTGRSWREWREVSHPTLWQVEQFLKRMSAEYRLIESVGEPSLGPTLPAPERKVYEDAFANYDKAQGQILVEFDGWDMTIKLPRLLKKDIGEKETLPTFLASLLYPGKRNIRPYDDRAGRPTYSNVRVPKKYIWKQFLDVANKFGFDVVYTSKELVFPEDDAPTEDVTSDVLANMWGADRASLTFNGKLYVLTGVADTDKSHQILGRGAAGIKLTRHDPVCPGFVEKEITVYEAKPRRKRGEAAPPPDEKRKKEIKVVKEPCVACVNGVERGAWYTAEASRAVRVKSAADNSALWAFQNEQRRLDTQFAESVERKQSAETFIAWSSAKMPLPGMGDPNIPCPPHYIDKKGHVVKIAYLPFQKAGILVASRNPISLIADEMGVGKTIQAIGVINNTPKIDKIIILAPSIALFNWEVEVMRWCVRCNPASTPNIKQRFKVQVMDTREEPDPKANIIILNYEKLVGEEGAPTTKWFMDRKWDLLIVDEAHYCKLRPGMTRDTISQRALLLFGWPNEDNVPQQQGLVHRADRVVYMTGTPIPNRPIEIWPLLNHMAPGEFGDRFHFGKKYCDLHKFLDKGGQHVRVPDYFTGEERGGKKAEASWDWKGAGEADRDGAFVRDTMPQLQALLRCYGMVRRLKTDVLDLPPKVRKMVDLPHTPDIERALEAERTAMLEAEGLDAEQLGVWSAEITEEWAKIQDQAKTILDQMSTLAADSPDWKYLEKQRIELMSAVRIPFKAISLTRHRMGQAKVGGSMAYIDGLFKEGLKKVVVFAYHNDVLDTMEQHFHNEFGGKYGGNCVVRISGKVSAKERQRATAIFQEDPNCLVFLGQLTAASTAITLTASNHVVMVEQEWVPGIMQQAEDRCHRIGSKNDAVFIHYLLVDGSIDGNMAKILLDKSEMQKRALNAPPSAADIALAFEGVSQGPQILDEDAMAVELETPEIVIPPPVVSAETPALVVAKPVQPHVVKETQILKTEFPSEDVIRQMLIAAGYSERTAEFSATALYIVLGTRSYNKILRPENEKARAVFAEITGFTLPVGLHRTQEAIARWAKLLAKAEEQDAGLLPVSPKPVIPSPPPERPRISPVAVRPAPTPVPVRPMPVPVRPMPVPVRPMPVPVRPMPVPVRPMPVVGGTLRAAQAQMALRYLITKGANVSPLGKGLARLPKLVTEGQVSTVLKEITPFVNMLPQPLVRMLGLGARANPRRTRHSR